MIFQTRRPHLIGPGSAGRCWLFARVGGGIFTGPPTAPTSSAGGTGAPEDDHRNPAIADNIRDNIGMAFSRSRATR
jgi:Na+/H+-translocating membrane pyrophosphatase